MGQQKKLFLQHTEDEDKYDNNNKNNNGVITENSLHKRSCQKPCTFGGNHIVKVLHHFLFCAFPLILG